jgi:hypothetical protein
LKRFLGFAFKLFVVYKATSLMLGNTVLAVILVPFVSSAIAFVNATTSTFAAQ